VTARDWTGIRQPGWSMPGNLNMRMLPLGAAQVKKPWLFLPRISLV